MHLPPDRPFIPSRFPLFYGWIILIVGTLGVLMTAPAQTMGVSPFTDFLIRDLHISRTSLSLAYLLGTLGSSFILSRAGRVYDQHGARLVGTVVIIILGAILLYLSFIPEITQAFSRLFPDSLTVSITIALVTLGFFFLRFTGQGVLALVARGMVLKWFERRRGLANAFVGIATTLGFSSAAIGFNGLTESIGWQQTWRLLGFFLIVPFALFFLLLARDNPAECGLKPDGRMVPRGTSGSKETRPAADFTLLQARRTLTFWVFLIIITIGSMYFTGLTFNIVSIFEESGYSRARAIAILLPSSLIALVLNVIGGWISDYIRLKYLLMLQGAGIFFGALAAIFLSAPYMVFLLIICKGLNGGMFGITSAVPWPRYYGLAHLGRITGFVMGWSVAGSALGPYLFSLSLDLFGNYRAVSIVVAVITLGMLTLSPFADRPAAPPACKQNGQGSGAQA